MTQTQLDQIREIGRWAHAGQVRDYTKLPYFDNHCIPVAGLAQDMIAEYEWAAHLDIFIVKAVCYLHDILEDTFISAETLRALLYDILDDLDDVQTIMEAVMLLTKPTEPFKLIDEYLAPIKENPLARLIKLSDNFHNSSDLKDQKRLDKYELIAYYLEN